jgi:hypothetical protein
VDEPGVLGEAAAVEEERHAIPIAHRSDRPQVAQRDGLAAARVVRDRDEDDRDVHRPLGEEPVERVDVHVALERVDRRRLATLGDDEVDGLGAGRLDVRSRRVEVGVVRDDLARAADDAEQDLLGSPALVGRDDVLEREERLDALEERVPARTARVALVAVLDGRPLVAAHRAGPGVREEVDEDVLRVHVEQVVAGCLDGLGALDARGQADRLNRVDPERLNDRAPAIHRGEDTPRRRSRERDQRRLPETEESPIIFGCVVGDVPFSALHLPVSGSSVHRRSLGVEPLIGPGHLGANSTLGFVDVGDVVCERVCHGGRLRRVECLATARSDPRRPVSLRRACARHRCSGSLTFATSGRRCPRVAICGAEAGI